MVRSDNTYYLYAHLSKVTVERNESVGSKDKIGEMGKSGKKLKTMTMGLPPCE